jgi:hypothetical protein
MARVVNLTPDVLQRIINEERAKLIAEARAGKAPKNAPPKEPTVKNGKKSTVPAQVEKKNRTAKKAMQLDEQEVDADEMASTVIKQAKQLKEMRSIESRLRAQLVMVVESRTDLERKLSKLL